jgi:Xaa-Pro aminopeptidase
MAAAAEFATRSLGSEGMVLSIDVPLFHAPWGGLRYEDTYLITGTGADPLDDFPTGILTS